jgi:hypothetical protein
VDERASGGRAREPDDHLQRGRLAGAVRPEEAGDSARANDEGQVVDRLHVAVVLRQALDHDRRGRLRNVRRLHTTRIAQLVLARIGREAELRLRPKANGDYPTLRPWEGGHAPPPAYDLAQRTYAAI